MPLDYGQTMKLMGVFYCENCDGWRPHMPYSDDELEVLHEPGAVTPACAHCREDFQCGECGYEIDQGGECQRPEGHEPAE